MLMIEKILGSMTIMISMIFVLMCCREWRYMSRQWEWERERREERRRRERIERDSGPAAESSRIERPEGEGKWNRTLEAMESMIAVQTSQVGKPIVLKDKPIVENFTGKGEINIWIKKIRRALTQIGGGEEEKIQFILNHVEGAAADRTFNMRQDWSTSEEIFSDLLKIYGRKWSVLEVINRMGARKQGEGESIWGFLDALMEISELAGQNDAINKNLLGECLAKNMKIQTLGLKLNNRMKERPRDSLQEWVEYIVEHEIQYRRFMTKETGEQGNEKEERKGRKEGEEEIRRRETEIRRWPKRCYRCNSDEHLIRNCPVRPEARERSQRGNVEEHKTQGN